MDGVAESGDEIVVVPRRHPEEHVSPRLGGPAAADLIRHGRLRHLEPPVHRPVGLVARDARRHVFQLVEGARGRSANVFGHDESRVLSVLS